MCTVVHNPIEAPDEFLSTYETSQPAWVSELSEAQQAVLEPPYIYNRPLIEENGETVIRPRTG